MEPRGELDVRARLGEHVVVGDLQRTVGGDAGDKQPARGKLMADAAAAVSKQLCVRQIDILAESAQLNAVIAEILGRGENFVQRPIRAAERGKRCV